jgi:hypothetical protein
MASPKTTFDGAEKSGQTAHVENIDQKDGDINVMEKLETDSSNISHDEDSKHAKPPTTARDLVTQILLVEDDPTLNPWTFRMWLIGIGISVFAG